MKRILTALLLHFNIVVFAQTYSNQDCITAYNACNFATTQYAFTNSIGIVKDFSHGATCISGGENNPSWFKIEVIKKGTLEFDIIPILSDDLDFVIYNLTRNSCNDIFDSLITPVRCSFSATNGITGLRTGYNDSIADTQDPPFCSPLEVDSGDIYILFINKFYGDNYFIRNFVIDFSQSTALLKQDTFTSKKVIENSVLPTEVCSTDSNIIGIRFEYPISCNYMDSLCSIFNITGPTSIVIDSCRYTCRDNQIIYAELSFSGTIDITQQYLFHISLPDSMHINNVCGGDTTVFLGVTSTPLFIGFDGTLFEPIISDYTLTPQRNDFFVESNTPYFAFESVFSNDVNIALTPFNNRFIIDDIVGTHEICVVGKVLCNRDTVCRLVTISPNVGIAETELAAALHVFPNPTNGIINITSKENLYNVAIEVYNIFGERVLAYQTKQLFKEEIYTLNISEKPSGIYFVKFQNAELSDVSKKIILNR